MRSCGSGSYASRWRAERAVASEADTAAELVKAMSLAAATDHASPNIDQDGLVGELGKELGLAEVTTPPIAGPLPDNSFAAAASRQEPTVLLPIV
jgi:hypothetical protein